MNTGTHTTTSQMTWRLETLQLPIWYRAFNKEARRDLWLTVVFDDGLGIAQELRVTVDEPTADVALDCLERALTTGDLNGGDMPSVLRTELSPLSRTPEFELGVTQWGLTHQHGSRGSGPVNRLDLWFQNLCTECLSELAGYGLLGAEPSGRETLDLVPAPKRVFCSPREIEHRIRLWEARR